MKRKAVLIAGPTASGKSALALERAEATGGVIVNADSMQVYDVLSVLTARPQPDDLARADHRLYGFIPPAERCSVGRYCAAARQVLDDPELDGRELIFVGGTGLYFDALQNGISEVPEVPDEAVAEAEAIVAPLDREGRQALLAEREPEMVGRLKEPDPQRLVRALAVRIATGRSLADWQSRAGVPVLDGFEIEPMVIWVDRDELSRRISTRFHAMLDTGATEEVVQLLSLDLASDLPAMKAIGVREIAAYLSGDLTRDEAIARAVIATRQYAKRQRTWFRQRMRDWTQIFASGARR